MTDGLVLRIVDGSDRGRVFAGLHPPLTIGREEGNSIQVNDERVSRFHLKIKHQDEGVVLTDLGSTNGTKVNGERVTLKKLRHGDMIQIGRTCLLYGSRDQIDARYSKLKELTEGSVLGSTSNLGEWIEKFGNAAPSIIGEKLLNAAEPPKLPGSLTPGQTLQITELLEFFHLRLRALISNAELSDQGQKATLNFENWQLLLDLQSHIAEYLQRISGEP